MELFACITNIQGEGLPLSFLFIMTKEKAAPLTKQIMLIAWMMAICSLSIDPWFTMSDKDLSEINVLREVWLGAKYQLCLWHILRALKQQLSQNNSLGSYNASEAHHAFWDIDLAFVSLEQMSTEAKVHTK